MKENGQITDTLLENEEFKKAYDDVVNEKEQVSYIWIDTKTKEMIKMETDVTKKKVFLHYYMKLVMEAPTYEELPSSVTKVIYSFLFLLWNLNGIYAVISRIRYHFRNRRWKFFISRRFHN